MIKKALVCISIFALMTSMSITSVSAGWRDNVINNLKKNEPSGTIVRIDADTVGYLEKIDNIYNLTIVSNDANTYKAEYEAGFIQGKLQSANIIAARDNLWDSAFLVDQSPIFIKQIPPSKEEIAKARESLLRNFNYTLQYLKNLTDPTIKTNLQRLFYRLVGIYHGTRLPSPANLEFGSDLFPTSDYFPDEEMSLGYETPSLTFMDIYFINGYCDLFDVLDNEHLPKCSAFVKKTDNEIYITHNSWMSFLDQSMTASFYINGDFFTVNFFSPGLIASGTDFGYNNKGIMFNETTHHYTYTEPKTDALWMIFRAALAEQFSSSMDEFYNYLSLEASGTYMNGYMIVDTNTNEIGLVEVSYRSFVYFKPDGNNGYEVITKPGGQTQEYDEELLQSDYILGINYPVSQLLRNELKALDSRPSRRTQFLARINDVNDIDSSKALITYTDPVNPLSIYGRWDLGYGDTPTPKTVPDGACDAKVASASMISYVSSLSGVFDLDSENRSFWMKFGSPIVNGKPFIWSESQWSSQKLRDVPDSIDGSFNLMNTYIR
jgi:hypothetical protein